MNKIIAALEQIEKTAKSGDSAKVIQAVESARQALSGTKDERMSQLNEELATWQKKLSVILKEPVGREGMARHAKHWIELLRKIEEVGRRK